MKSSTLQNVIETMRAEGQLNRNNGTNSIKSMKDLLRESIEKDATTSVGIVDAISGITINAPVPLIKPKSDDDVPSKGDEKENKKDDEKQQSAVLAALTNIGSTLGIISKDQNGSGKISGGLGKLLLGGAVFVAIKFLTDNWEEIAAKFEEIKPRLIELKDWLIPKIKDTLGFIFDNFQTIATSLGAIWLGLKVWKGISLMITAVTAIKTAVTAFTASQLVASTSLTLSAAKLRVTGLLGRAASLFGAGVMAAAAGMSGALVALGPALVVLAPFIAIAAGIGLAIYGVYKGIEEAMAVFEDTGSVTMALTEGLGMLVGAIVGFPLNLVKDIISWVAGAFGFTDFEKKLDDFDFITTISDAVSNIFDIIGVSLKKMANSVVTMINDALDWVGVDPIALPFDIQDSYDAIANKNETRDARRALEKKETREAKQLALHKENADKVNGIDPLAGGPNAMILANLSVKNQQLAPEQATAQLIAQQSATANSQANVVNSVDASTRNNTSNTTNNNAIMSSHPPSVDIFDRSYSF